MASRTGDFPALLARHVGGDALHRADADADELGHRLGGPVCSLARRVLKGQRHHTLGYLSAQWRDARGTGLVPQKAIQALLHEPLLPTPHRGLADAGCAHDLGRADAIGSQQHDPRPPNVLLGTVSVRQDRAEPAAIGGACLYGDACSRPIESHSIKPLRIPPGLKRQLCGTLNE